MRKTPSVALNEHQQDIVNRLVASGRYTGLSDVVRAGIRLVEEHEAKYLAETRAMETAVAEALASGDAEAMESAGTLIAEFDTQRKVKK